ncbi:Diaminopimelate epimerase [uncultured Defluviicoccus sp.]|uniref:diaminopimelate epimerase n=1 Tax=metagenome TaxID=256318 RepID=A0A380TE62_9ZZZZ|nr:Diaminopimelate epimerase [uncultured Defluviicoccus sp.]
MERAYASQGREHRRRHGEAPWTSRRPMPIRGGMDSLAFTKMHGLGNDFVVIDARRRPVAMAPDLARAIADRRQGVGCDQLIVIEQPTMADADAFMRIFNADGGEVGACGNAARCIAALLMQETGAGRIGLETAAGLIHAQAAAAGNVSVDLGPVRTDWQAIPLAEARDTLHLDVTAGALGDGVAVSVGNPHIVFFVADADAVPLAELGPQIEHHPLFPERTNVEFVQVLGPSALRVRVWERGAGITRACGTGACAAAVAAARRRLSERRVEVLMDGGPLQVDWRADGTVCLTGPVATSFTGSLAPAWLSAAERP